MTSSASDRRPRRVVAALLVLVAAVTAGCSWTGGLSSGGFPSGGFPSGDHAAEVQLDRLQTSIFNEALLDFRRGDDPVVLARWATNDSGPSQQGVNGGPPFENLVEALSWSSVDGLDGVVDLAMSVTTTGYEDHTFGGDSYGPGSARRCVRIHVGTSDASVVTVDCAGRTPVVVPEAPRPAGPPSERRLRAVMGHKSLTAIEAAARKAFPSESVTASTLDGYWVVVVVREAPDLACIGATRDPQGRVRVSTAPRIRPGEGDCDPDRFVHGPVYGH